MIGKRSEKQKKNESEMKQNESGCVFKIYMEKYTHIL